MNKLLVALWKNLFFSVNKRKRKPRVISPITSPEIPVSKSEKVEKPQQMITLSTPSGFRPPVPTTLQRAVPGSSPTLTNLVQSRTLPMMSLLRPGQSLLQKSPPMPGIVTGAHAPLILVPVNSSSPGAQIVNAIPVSTSLSKNPNSTETSTVQTTKIILSVPDPRPPSSTSSTTPPHQKFILMTNVSQLTPTKAAVPNGPQLIRAFNVPQQVLTSPLPMKANQANFPVINNSTYQNISNSVPHSVQQSSVSSSVPVLSRILNKRLDAVEKLQSMDEDMERDSSPTPDSLAYPVTPPRTPDDQQSEDSSSAASVSCTYLIFWLLEELLFTFEKGGDFNFISVRPSFCHIHILHTWTWFCFLKSTVLWPCPLT